jgi:hypothetical protein
VQEGALPPAAAVDGSNPFLYCNDIPLDNFNGELALAMASDADGIDLRGYVHEFPVVPWWDSAEKYRRLRDRYVRHHRKTRRKAEQSGFTGLPPAELGLYRRHERPSSGTIEETDPVGSAGTEAILDAAEGASPETPLVVAVGGPLCTVADAYLTDPSIRNRVVVFCRFRRAVDEWNAFLSGWSATVVVRRLRTVLCPAAGGPLVERSRVEEALPEEPLKRYMLTKVYEGTGENPLADGQKWEGDAVSILSAAHPAARTPPEYLRFDGLKSHWAIGEVLPSFRAATEETPTQVVSEHDHGVMNETWWGHMTDPTTWGRA